MTTQVRVVRTVWR